MPDQITILSVLFFLVFPIPILLVGRLAKKYAPPSIASSLFWQILLFYVVYLALVSVASFYGLFDKPTLPPLIILFTTIPLLSFYFLFVQRTATFKKTFDSIPVHELVGVHIFRLIGSTFLLLSFLEELPDLIGYIAGTGDVITAITSLWVAKLLKDGKPSAKTVALVWNSFGLLDILATSATAILLTKWSIDTGSQGVEILAKFPFCFIPAFAPATIVFLHMAIFKKLLAKKNR